MKVRKSKEKCPAGEKPVPVKTHYRSMIVSKKKIKNNYAVYIQFFFV